MDFHPPIQSRSTEELLKIAADHDTWQPEARALARIELDKRGVPVQVVEDRTREFSEASVAHERIREQHATESCSATEMTLTFIGAPLLLAMKLFAGKYGFKLGLSDLDRRNFKRKYRQKMTMLVTGMLVWVAVLTALT